MVARTALAAALLLSLGTDCANGFASSGTTLTFTAKLGSKNGVKASVYQFERGMTFTTKGSYSSIMIAECKKFHMKPVCDHRNYCKNDKKALYLGQQHHIAYKPHRKNNSYMPGAFAAIQSNWDGLCSYTGKANGNNALCNIPANSHSWQKPTVHKDFICARRGIAATFTATLGKGRYGVAGSTYMFERGTTFTTKGSYSSIMIAECKKFGMKPVCDHPSYCRNDKKAVYIGQNSHIAYRPYRNIASWFPSGWSKIKTNWDGLCSYTANANGNHALCNIPSNTHAWKSPAFKRDFICAKKKAATFKVTLSKKNGIASATYTFQKAFSATRKGSYSNAMIAACKKLNMKPVCDHPSYCRNDKKALYIGQSSHLAYRPHRINNNYVPRGFSRVQTNWNGVCSYTSHASGNNALCNIPSNTHAWRNPSQTNPGFICGRRPGSNSFTVNLGGKNGNGGPSTYTFEKAMPASRSGKYSSLMIAACKKLNMKPVCDHPSYCKNDKNALYIGQTGHIAYKPHRNNKSYFPSGWTSIRSQWTGLCSYTKNANGNYALCNIPTNTHAWKTAAQYNPGFMCGSRPGSNAFTAKLGKGRYGVKAATYTFEKAKLTVRSGKYSTRMIAACKKLGMKPVCDHPSYCRNDAKSLYIGQANHIEYPPHRRINGWFPSGWSKIRNNWNGLCGYTNNANGNYALCNIPTNTHAWRNPAQYNPGFICGKRPGTAWKTKLATKNGVGAAVYTFQKVSATSKSGSYSSIMIASCKKIGSKPVCDHPSYCRNDKNAVYIGQTGHLAYAPHRNSNNYVPGGFAAIRSNWVGVCSYTGHANGNHALCNIPTNTHAWRTVVQYNPGFICAKRAKAMIWTATMGAKNGVTAGAYKFARGVLVSKSGSYSSLMIAACKKLGMKPVCDHPSYCKNDAKALYIGQSHHIAYNPHRKNNSYFPSGWSTIRSNWNGLCSYTKNANGNNALCNIPTNTHAWRRPTQYNPGFVCGKRMAGTKMTTHLGARNGVSANTYTFEKAFPASTSGSYQAQMINACKKLGMKPVCDHPSYCKNDKNALYIGQKSHIAYRPYRNKASWFPKGWPAIKTNWLGLCSYTAHANGNYALCNVPTNTHAWKRPNQYNPGFMCGKIGGSDGSCADKPKALAKMVKGATCSNAKKMGLCKREKEMASTYCAKTCGVCQATCVDHSTHCAKDKYKAQCATHEIVQQTCCKTCKAAMCTDKSKHCKDANYKKQCKTNHIVRETCCQTCTDVMHGH